MFQNLSLFPLDSETYIIPTRLGDCEEVSVDLHVGLLLNLAYS